MSFLFTEILLLFALAVVVAVVAMRFRLPAMVSFLLTGVLVGPYGLGLISAVHEVEQLAEIGVILLLFTVGLEFSLDRLNQMRGTLLGAGGLQVLMTIGATTVVALWFNVPAERAVFLGFLVALSSTAIVFKLLVDRGETDAPHGRFSIGILLFQDLCVIPMVTLVPVLGSVGGVSVTGIGQSLAQAFLIIAFVLFAGRRLIPFVFAQIVKVGSQDLFVLTVVLVCWGTAWITAHFGLSVALGAFVAGIVISESPYTYQVLSDVLPFRAAFNSLFFISIGMLLDLSFVFASWPLVTITVLGLLLLKLLIIIAIALIFGHPLRVAIQTGMVLSQIGEFSFVLLRMGQEQAIVSGDLYQLFLASAVLTMLATPLLVAASPGLSHWLDRRVPRQLSGQLRGQQELEEETVETSPRVIIAGYGLNGRNLAKALRQSAVPYVVLALNPDAIRRARQEGDPIFYGDVTSPEILSKAGITHAQVLVFAISDPDATRRAVRQARRLNPSIYILVRTKYVEEIDVLYSLGADEVIAEEFETSLEILSRVLFHLFVPSALIEQQVSEIRQERYDMFRQAPRMGPTHQRLFALLSQAQVEISTAIVGPSAAGNTLADLALRSRTGTSAIAVLREGVGYPNPPPAFRLERGDWVVLIGTMSEIAVAETLLAATRESATPDHSPPTTAEQAVPAERPPSSSNDGLS
ncbi:MAG: cation:proton antiporter [Candidatus Binatia bacterium]